MIKLMKNKKGSSVIILVFSILAILGLASFALDLGVVLNQRYEMQKAVESAALIAASEYELYESGANFAFPTSAQITNTNAMAHYNALLNTNQLIRGLGATITVTPNASSRAVRFRAVADVPTYFLNLLTVKKVQIQAEAAAVNLPVYLSEKYPKPSGSILWGDSGTYLDTEIKEPLGSIAASTTTVANQNKNYKNIFGAPDGKSVSLGPGGYITLKLPDTLVDGKGVDFAIYEDGNAEGYFVYAGIDTDPADPYIDAAHPGAGINWVNVSCTGIPLYVNKNQRIGAHQTTVILNGVSRTDYKFYGSGLFDLGNICTTGAGTVIYNGTATTSNRISNVKYLKIIDDNREDGFFIQGKTGIATPSAIPMLIPGEHSTITPGADLDALAIFHHSRLISLTAFTTDTDGDGLIDDLERTLGLNPNNVDSDGDGINDNVEYTGTAGTTFLNKDCPTWAQPVPFTQIGN